MARSAITFQMTGLESVLKRIEKYDKALSTGIDKVLDDGIENIANNARNFAPQGKTGHLRASISADKRSLEQGFMYLRRGMALCSTMQ
jgi:hypothetical protein